jgi:hypothetical protein
VFPRFFSGLLSTDTQNEAGGDIENEATLPLRLIDSFMSREKCGDA